MTCLKRPIKLVTKFTQGLRHPSYQLPLKRGEVNGKSLKCLEKTAVQKQFGWWNLVDWEGECVWSLREGMQWKWEKQRRAESKEMLSEKNSTPSFIIAYGTAPRCIIRHSRPSASWCQPISQVSFPSTSPRALGPAALCAVSQQHGAVECISPLNSPPPLPPPRLLGKLFRSFWTFQLLLHTLLSATSTHHTPEAEVIAFSLSFDTSSSTFARGQKAHLHHVGAPST